MKAVYTNSFEYKYYGSDIVVYNKTLFPEFSLELFNPDYLAADNSLQYKNMGTLDAKGRGSVHAFNYNDQNLVLRHYYRGGAAGKFIRDTYLWRGLDKTRAIDELRMLFIMQEMNLPVPTPAAAHTHRTSFTYTADIITQLIPQTQSLCSILIKNSLSSEIWERIGSVIRQFHDNHCNHADLNAHNILINEKGRIFLIDFDKARIDKYTNVWQQANLARLERSLTKLKNIESRFNYSQQDFKSLIQGYRHN